MTVAESVFGDPAAHALFVIDPRVPAPGAAVANVRLHVWLSDPVSVMTTEPSSLTVAEPPFAAGAVLAAGASCRLRTALGQVPLVVQVTDPDEAAIAVKPGADAVTVTVAGPLPGYPNETE